MNLHALLVRLKTQERAGADKAVTSQAFAADHALEQEGPVPFLDLAEGADRGQRIADELAIDRHQARVPSQLREFIE